MASASASALYETGDVITLTPQNFQSLVIQSDFVWIVQFYAPWCSYSKRIESQYKAMATVLKNKIKVGALDAHRYNSLNDVYNIIGYPSIKIFGINKSKPISVYELENETMQDVVNAAWTEKVKLERNNL